MSNNNVIINPASPFPRSAIAVESAPFCHTDNGFRNVGKLEEDVKAAQPSPMAVAKPNTILYTPCRPRHDRAQHLIQAHGRETRDEQINRKHQAAITLKREIAPVMIACGSASRSTPKVAYCRTDTSHGRFPMPSQDYFGEGMRARRIRLLSSRRSKREEDLPGAHCAVPHGAGGAEDIIYM